MLVYYALHSAKNQARKFVRTWAFVLLVALAVLGGAAAFAVRWYAERLREAGVPTAQDMLELLSVSGLTPLDALELILGLVILGILVLQVIGAEKSTSRLFMQADVNMLFPSPLTPQAILAFRVATTLALPIAVAPLQLMWAPAAARMGEISLLGALTLPLAWCMTLGFSALLKMGAFELGSCQPFWRRNLRWFLLGSLALVGVLFCRAYAASAERNLLTCAQRTLNASWMRLVPVWGWIKGMVVEALQGHLAASVGFLCLNLLLLVALAWLVMHAKADYYEQTLGWTEDMARFRDEISADNAALVIMELEGRGFRRHGEGFRHGWGASVYFFKVLHHRMRFARSGFVTKTMMTYLFAAVAAGLFARLFMDEPVPYIAPLLLVAMVFFRTVISSVTEDVRKDSFLLLPAPISSKFFCSLAGGATNCALDVTIPLLAGSLAAGFSPLAGLAYLPVLCCADFFASAVGVFADVSIPAAIGVSLKQVAKVLLLYVGLIFDGMVVTSGLGSGNVGLGFVLASVINVLLGLTFMGLCGVWLHPRHGRPAIAEARPIDEACARRAYARVGIALSAMFLVVYGGRFVLSETAPPLVATALPLFVLGPLSYRILAGKTDAYPKGTPLRPHEVLALVPLCLFVAYVGNAVGFVLSGVLGALPHLGLVPEVGVGAGEEVARSLMIATFASPVMEEYVFRRCLISRLAPFGERTALVVSALAFGLFHESANQLVYGTLLGLVFGYVYLRSGRLRYTIGAHVAVNLLSALVLVLLMGLADSPSVVDATLGASGTVLLAQVMGEPRVLALVACVSALLVLALLGAVLFAYGVSERRIVPGGIRLGRALSSWGMVVFLALTVLALL